MKKRFLLGMSFLLIASFFNLQSSYPYYQILPDIDFMPFAEQWFEELKLNYPDAGFDDATFLRAGCQTTSSGVSIPQGWCATYYKNPSAETKSFFSENLLKSEFNSLEKIKIICGDKDQLILLNQICFIYYRYPEELSLECKEYLDTIEAVFLHEIYHCLKSAPNKTLKLICEVSLGVSIGSLYGFIIAADPKSYISYEERKKTAQYSILCSTAFASLASLCKAFMIYNQRQNEYEADMHAIRYGNSKTSQNMILFLQNHDKGYEASGWKIYDPSIKELESAKEKSWIISQPLYTTLIYMLKGMQNLYIDPEHPSLETRIKYFTQALNQAKQ